VRVEPAPERLSVRGLPHLGWNGTRLLLPGDYTVRAQREGYRPLEARLAVTTDRNQVARFVLERLPGRVRVETHPADGVRFFVDGAERGTTPLAPLEVAAGDHEVSLRAEGFKVFTTRLNVAGGGAEETLRATLVPDRAPVSFTSAPAEALVRVDGGDVGRTPLTALLSSGAREVTVSLAGHRSAARTITVVAEQPLTVPPFRLEPLPGRLRVASDPPGAAVSVDGEFRGETPLEITVAPRREHALRLTKAGHEAAQTTVTLDLDEEKSLSLALAARMGDVEVTAEPADAEVLVDGEVKGRVGQTLKLTATAHEIEVRRSGYAPQRVTITPRPDFPQAVKVRLRSLQEPKAAGPSRLSVRGHELRLLAPGRFQLGASRREPGRRANETLREVELRRPSYLSLARSPTPSSGASRPAIPRAIRKPRPRRRRATGGAGDLGAGRRILQLALHARRPASGLCEPGRQARGHHARRHRLPPAHRSRVVAGGALPGGRRAQVSVGRLAAGGARLRQLCGRVGAAGGVGRTPGYDDRFPVSSPVGSFRPNALGFFDLGATWRNGFTTSTPFRPRTRRWRRTRSAPPPETCT
jgi:hypothetical protein